MHSNLKCEFIDVAAKVNNICIQCENVNLIDVAFKDNTLWFKAEYILRSMYIHIDFSMEM